MATSEDPFLADLDELSDDETELEENDAQKEEEEDEIITNNLNYDDLDSVSKLQKTQRFSDIMEKVEKALDFDSEYKLIVDCHKLLVKINKETIVLHNFIRHNYRFKSPNLEWLVTHATITYARVIKRIVNETELNPTDLDDLFQSAIISGVSSTARGKPVPKDVPEKTIEACDRVLDLYSSKKKVLEFIEIKSKLKSVCDCRE
ncbi:putative U4PU6 small nuclear ribonucleoprotein Prp31 [Cardamine amara subsp. amara]|uniref:U4PU6 small nuclear ribonucleoprotein Prp31 n=1 Tax=Cardamine amara subsp. amara TaxID=228776 RepID=A0ABD1BG02_CARAN